MRDHIRKFAWGGAAPGAGLMVLAAAALAIGAAYAETTIPPPVPATRGRTVELWTPCPIAEATIETSVGPAREIDTRTMELVLTDRQSLVLDARPREEFAMGHIPGALNVAPKPGLAMSQYTSDVAEIEKLTMGDKRRSLVLYCNGPFCGKSKRLAADLVAAGYTGVVRYQLGIPVWRALGHPTQAEGEAIWSALDHDKTAVVIDAREPEAFQAKSLPGARNVRASEVSNAKDDGRLPMLDHNTRIFVIGKDETEARAVAQEIAKNAFHNVSFFAGPIEALMRIQAGSGTR